MNEFGFHDSHRNTEVLVTTNGNVELAINWLLEQENWY
jgi:hypothetical protein